MIALIDYDAGNTCSVMNALDRAGADYILTADEAQIRSAEKVIFPGVGHAAAAMEALDRKGLVHVIKSLTQPVLGICVGMQLMAQFSEEGDTQCLGIVPGRVTRFIPAEDYKVPHMGWNRVKNEVSDIIFNNIDDGEYFYFVHSYYLPVNECTISTCSHSEIFSCAVRKDNFVGIQFHAEKSGKNGAALLDNFIKGAL